jgi:hypothetical protein
VRSWWTTSAVFPAERGLRAERPADSAVNDASLLPKLMRTTPASPAATRRRPIGDGIAQ